MANPTPKSIASAGTAAGAFVDPQNGQLLSNGYILAQLAITPPNGVATLTGGGQVVASQLAKITLDANGVPSSGQSMYGSDQYSSPVNPPYNLNLYDSNNNQRGVISSVVISGAAPLDLTVLTTTAGAASFPSPVLLSPAGNQTITNGNLTLTGDLLPSANAARKIGGTSLGWSDVITAGSPWFDVRAYGAKCDGITDDTAAVQAALNAANTQGGGTVFIPPLSSGSARCIIAGTLDMHGFRGVCIKGTDAKVNPVLPRAWLTFTSASSPLINMQSTTACKISGVYLQYSNAGNSGTFIDMSHGAGTDSQYNVIENCFIGALGAGSLTNMGILIDLDGADNVRIRDNELHNAQVAIRGANPSGSGYSINHQIERNEFSGASPNGDIVLSMIRNAHQTWLISANDFEMGQAVGTPKVMDWTGTAIAQGINFFNNFVGDTPAASATTFFALANNSRGFNVFGNLIQAGTSQLATVFSFPTNFNGFVSKGNSFLQLLTIFAFGTNNVVELGPDDIAGTVTNQFTGNPVGGSITPEAGNQTMYGVTTIGQTGVSGSGQASANLRIIGSTFATQSWQSASGAADQKWWDAIYGSTTIDFRAVNDANSVANDWMTVNRGAGATIANVTFPAPLILTGGLSGWKGLTPVGNGASITLGQDDKTAQSASIGSTTLITGTASSGGHYTIHYQLACTATDASGATVSVTFGWTSDGIARTNTGATIGVNATSNQQFGGFGINSDNSVNITYSTTVTGTPTTGRYSLHVWVTKE
jgi:hypothetical protein